MTLQKYLITARLAHLEKTSGGLLYLIPGILVDLSYLLPLLFLWRVLASQGVSTGMSLSQMLSYTYISALLSELLAVQTFASSWSYEGQLISLYTRPLPVFGQIIAQTMGGWGRRLMVFSLPMMLIAPFFGVSIAPATLWFFPSLLLCVSLGFAVDFLFACLTIRLKGSAWLAYVIRMAVVSLFSGTMIPFKLLPFGLDQFFTYQPFGSLGGAPLSLFVGTASPLPILTAQILWNILLWPAAILWFERSRERLVSYGG